VDQVRERLVCLVGLGVLLGVLAGSCALMLVGRPYKPAKAGRGKGHPVEESIRDFIHP